MTIHPTVGQPVADRQTTDYAGSLHKFNSPKQHLDHQGRLKMKMKVRLMTWGKVHPRQKLYHRLTSLCVSILHCRLFSSQIRITLETHPLNVFFRKINVIISEVVEAARLMFCFNKDLNTFFSLSATGSSSFMQYNRKGLHGHIVQTLKRRDLWHWLLCLWLAW